MRTAAESRGARPRRDDLARRVGLARDKAAIPAYEGYVEPELLDVEAWNHVGDPLAEALLAKMRDRKLMGGDILANARALQAQGARSAVDFFADVEHVPAWADFEAMRAGARMARRNPIGMLFGMHGALPFTYIDSATAAVMGSTGRMSGQRGAADFDRRFWETASGFVGALDVDAMRPGGVQWEKWVRIRLLHTMIRLGILRSGRWDLTRSMPISQPATAAGAYIFGSYRVAIIRELGGHVSAEEEYGFALMWRWITRLEGASSELLGAWPDGQDDTMRAIATYLYSPDQASREVTNAMLDGLAAMPVFGPLPRRLHAAVLRRLMSERALGVYPGLDVPAALGVAPDAVGEAVVGLASGVLRLASQSTRLPVVAHVASRVGGVFIDRVVEHGLAGQRAAYAPSAVRGDHGGRESASDETGPGRTVTS